MHCAAIPDDSRTWQIPRLSYGKTDRTLGFGLPRTEQELREALQQSRGVMRQRILDKLTELEESQYRNIDDLVPEDNAMPPFDSLES